MLTPKRVLERRRSVRIKESFLFKIGDRGYEAQAITLNISSSGAMCVVDKDIPVMNQLNVGLQIPPTSQGKQGKIIHMKGVVVRKEKDMRTGRYLIGIYFSDIKPGDKKLLDQFIVRYLKRNP